MTITNSAQLSPAVREYYDRLLLMTAYPQLVHTRFAQKRMLPQKSGDTIVFRRYSKLDTVTVPMVDGVTPPAAPLSATDIKARIDWYGNFVVLTDQVAMTVEDRTLNEASRLLAQNMGQTLDEITRDVLASIATTLQAANGQNGGTPTEQSKKDFDIVVKTLLGNDADMILPHVDANNKFSTAAVRPSFCSFMHTDLIDDLENVANFLSASNYPNQNEVQPGEWGSTGNIRHFYTSVGIKSSAATPVYTIPIVGQEAYACIHLGSDMGEFDIKPLGSGGSEDPLNQRGSVSWKHPFAARVLNDAFGCLLLVTHS